MAMSYMPVPFEFLEDMEDLTDEEFGRLIRWGLMYQTTGEVRTLEGNERFFRAMVKNNIDRVVAKWYETSEKRKIAGAKGGQQKAANASNDKQMLANAIGEKQKFGKYVELTTVEYSFLLKDMGYSEFIRCKAAVDLEVNQGGDWLKLILDKHKEEEE